MLDSLPATGPEIAEGTLATVGPTLVVGGLGVSSVGAGTTGGSRPRPSTRDASISSLTTCQIVSSRASTDTSSVPDPREALEEEDVVGAMGAARVLLDVPTVGTVTDVGVDNGSVIVQN